MDNASGMGRKIVDAMKACSLANCGNNHTGFPLFAIASSQRSRAGKKAEERRMDVFALFVVAVESRCFCCYAELRCCCCRVVCYCVLVLGWLLCICVVGSAREGLKKDCRRGGKMAKMRE